jgi:broad specificity phosphatase PhoE
VKILIIRHADPDYAVDSLTNTGWKEAEHLAKRLLIEDVKAFYVSPLGRARDMASVTLDKMDREAEILPWLREFSPMIVRDGIETIVWDWLPAEWTAIPEFYDRHLWHTVPVMRQASVFEEYSKVTDGLDNILREHGYERSGEIYRAIRASNDTLVFFCHFGVECVMLSHLLGISPMILWHGFCAAPSSVTTLVTEERREGAASFRVSSFGDVSHLYAAGLIPSFSARFCETYGNIHERHD